MTTEADKQVQDPDLKERLDLTKYNCNSIKLGLMYSQEKIVHMNK